MQAYNHDKTQTYGDTKRLSGQPHMLLSSGDHGPCPTTPLSQDQAQLLIFTRSRRQSLRSKPQCAHWLRGRPACSPASTGLPPTGASLRCWQHAVMTHAGEPPATSSVPCGESYLAARHLGGACTARDTYQEHPPPDTAPHLRHQSEHTLTVLHTSPHESKVKQANTHYAKRT